MPRLFLCTNVRVDPFHFRDDRSCGKAGNAEGRRRRFPLFHGSHKLIADFIDVTDHELVEVNGAQRTGDRLEADDVTG